jgi:riboflavin kinase/FMN adenylyltransferase
MLIIRHIDTTPEALKGAVIAIGNFDGVHIGHRALIEQGKAIAKAANKPFAIFTFEPHPRRIFQPESPHIRLTSFAEKAELLKELGVNAICVQRFSKSFSGVSAASFVEDILVGRLAATHIITGADFVFGKGRAGSKEMLADYSHKGVFGYTAYIPLESSNEKVSSTRIRTLLSEGKCLEASALLARRFAISGRVMHGDKRGRTFGFPTANIALHNRFLPKFGVYAVKVVLGGNASPAQVPPSLPLRVAALPLLNSPTYLGVANLGIRPMYDTKAPLLEVHLFDFSGDIYGAKMTIEFCEYIRGEQKFASEKELIDAMNHDAKKAKEILKMDIK